VTSSEWRASLSSVDIISTRKSHFEQLVIGAAMVERFEASGHIFEAVEVGLWALEDITPGLRVLAIRLPDVLGVASGGGGGGGAEEWVI
jgi:hypothetical protein